MPDHFFRNWGRKTSKEQNLQPQKWGNSTWYPIGFAKQLFGDGQYLQDFLEIPELNAILNIRARAMSSGIVNIQSKATGKEQAANQSLVRVLRSPNWFQGQDEFWRQSSLFRDIWGNEYIYFLTPVGLSSTFKGMYTLNPADVTIEYDKKTPYFLQMDDESVGYYFTLDGKKIPLDKANTIHLNDNRVETGNILQGISKLKALQPALKNIRAAYQKRNIALNMPIGILSNNQTDATGLAVPLPPGEKNEAQADLKRHGALPILTSLGVGYSDMTINAANMGLFEETREDTARICDAYGVPYEMLAAQKGVTFANLKEAKKQFYEETIAPDMNERISALNNHLDTDSKSWHIVVDFKHLPVFAEDARQRAQSINTMTMALNRAFTDGAITIEQYQNELKKFDI